jgi:hypothetical protein
MITITALSNALVDVLGKSGLEPKSIREAGRRLMESGKIKKGTRGRTGGARMDA